MEQIEAARNFIQDAVEYINGREGKAPDPEAALDALAEATSALAQAEKDKQALDKLCEILSTGDRPWPSGADFLDWTAEIVRQTGRVIR